MWGVTGAEPKGLYCKTWAKQFGVVAGSTPERGVSSETEVSEGHLANQQMEAASNEDLPSREGSFEEVALQDPALAGATSACTKRQPRQSKTLQLVVVAACCADLPQGLAACVFSAGRA